MELLAIYLGGILQIPLSMINVPFQLIVVIRQVMHKHLTITLITFIISPCEDHLVLNNCCRVALTSNCHRVSSGCQSCKFLPYDISIIIVARCCDASVVVVVVVVVFVAVVVIVVVVVVARSCETPAVVVIVVFIIA